MDNSNVDMRITPARMAHFVIRTNRYGDMVDWYVKVFQADVVFKNDFITFLSFDDEHHRLAIVNQPDLVESSDKYTGIDHVAFSFDHLSELLANYERLTGLGIKPLYTVNHGPTTSIYYADPNSNKVELQVDNFSTLEESQAFFQSEAFAKNFIGEFFDADIMLAKLRSGVPESELLKQGAAPVAG